MGLLIFLILFFSTIVLLIGTIAGFVSGSVDQEVYQGQKFLPCPNPLTKIVFTYPLAYRVAFYLTKPYARKD